MFESLMNVRYITSKNSFCYLSASNLKHLQNKYVKLLYNDNECVCVSVELISVSIDDQSIGINTLFAKTLGIEENSLVAVTEISRPSTIQSVTVTAINDNDHCVLESLADTVQSTLLQQISVLNSGQRFVIWIGKAIHVTVTVCDIKPFSPGIIDNLTEVVIKQPEKHNKIIPNNDAALHNKSVEIEPTMDFLKEYNDKEENLILRIVPYKEIIDKIEPFSSLFNVFAFKKVFDNYINTAATAKIYSAKLLNADSEIKPVYVRLYVFEDILKDFKLSEICSGNIFASETLIEYFNCDIGTRILLEPYSNSPPEVNEVEIYTKKNYSIDVLQCFQNFLAKNCKHNEFILNSDVVMDVTSKLRCFLRFQPSEAKFCYVTKDFVRNFKSLVINETIPQKEKTDEREFDLNKYTTNVANFQEIIDKCSFLFVCNTRAFSKMYNVLITGKSGTGKTTLTKIVAHLINAFPGFIYTKKINCKSIKGKTVESLQKLLTSTFVDLIHRQPSVLILDDLHVLCEKVSEGETVAQLAVYFNRVSEMLEGLFKYYCEYNAVGILATAESTAKLNKYIYATRGNHLFKNVYNISHLEKNDRRKLLEFFFSPYILENVNLDEFAAKTESFVTRDMFDFANKTLFESYHEDYNQSKMKIKTQHCEKALETVTGTSLSGVNLHSPGVRDLDDIGGLNDAKRKLVETMLWPAKYPDLFSNAPLRLPSGLLFYGPPGTGKTILAGAAAKHCGLRLISIKGPELLSKYIGASEQAVRDVFQRAQSAKPCILFFDEFDSLAPRRGHDNTGVTDRVVNQLLTQLDGIETLSGVFVLAATSRPDLLDPALLRPGRLDIHIHCPLPDADSRLDILNILSKSLKLSSDVNLAEIAKATEGFSGADLQSVLYSAQLDSFKGLLSEDENENIEQVHLEICQAQLMEALKNTKPSLTKAEQKRYEEIYRSFQQGMTSTPGTKATLA